MYRHRQCQCLFSYLQASRFYGRCKFLGFDITLLHRNQINTENFVLPVAAHPGKFGFNRIYIWACKGFDVGLKDISRGDATALWGKIK